jgi:hypothetical protein
MSWEAALVVRGRPDHEVYRRARLQSRAVCSELQANLA